MTDEPTIESIQRAYNECMFGHGTPSFAYLCCRDGVYALAKGGTYKKISETMPPDESLKTLEEWMEILKAHETP